MTRLLFIDGRHVDVEIPAHTLIAMRIEAAHRGDEHITIAGQVFRLAEIETIVAGFFLAGQERSAA